MAVPPRLGTAARPLTASGATTAGRQRGFYSEILGETSKEDIKVRVTFAGWCDADRRSCDGTWTFRSLCAARTTSPMRASKSSARATLLPVCNRSHHILPSSRAGSLSLSVSCVPISPSVSIYLMSLFLSVSLVAGPRPPLPPRLLFVPVISLTNVGLQPLRSKHQRIVLLPRTKDP